MEQIIIEFGKWIGQLVPFKKEISQLMKSIDKTLVDPFSCFLLIVLALLVLGYARVKFPQGNKRG